MKALILALAFGLLANPCFAQVMTTPEGVAIVPQVESAPVLKPQMAAVTKQPFLGPGVKVIGRQLAFPFRHPLKFTNNCTHPVRHPLVAFKQFSHWAEPYNSGMEFVSSAASIAGSAALQTLWTNKHF